MTNLDWGVMTSGRRSSRSRSISEPPELPSRRHSHDNVEADEERQQQTWTGSIYSYISSFWTQDPSLNDPALVEEMSEPEGNLSEYEEQIRRNRNGEGESPAVPIASRLRKASIANSPVVSPRQQSSQKSYLDVGDFGIHLVDPDGHDPTECVMTPSLIGKLHAGLPSRWRMASAWTLLYSTNFHGFSLSTMYAQAKGFPGPVLIVIRDASDNLFGAFVTEALHPHIGHFGTGECFLWKVSEPDGRVIRYRSTGLNDYFVLCDPSSLAVGCGEGKFGLWIDAQLENGHTHSVPTFNNEPLARSEAFECMVFELWGLECQDA